MSSRSRTRGGRKKRLSDKARQFGSALRLFLQQYKCPNEDAQEEFYEFQQEWSGAPYALEPFMSDSERIVPRDNQLQFELGSADMIYLDRSPVDERWRPMLSFSYNFRSGSVVRFRVALFRCLKDNESVDDTVLKSHASGRLACGSAVRLESPEARAESGKLSSHGFFHGQLIASTTKDSTVLPQPGLGISASTPALPLFAIGPADLVLCLSLSLYGPTPCNRELRQYCSKEFWKHFPGLPAGASTRRRG